MSEDRKGWIIAACVIVVILIALIVGYRFLEKTGPSDVQLVLDGANLSGNCILKKIPGDSPLKTSYRVVHFRYARNNYKIEVPTKDIITRVYISSADLNAHSATIKFEIENFKIRSAECRIYKT